MSGPSFQDPHALLNMIAFTVIQASHESASDLGSFESTQNKIILGSTNVGKHTSVYISRTMTKNVKNAKIIWLFHVIKSIIQT